MNFLKWLEKNWGTLAILGTLLAGILNFSDIQNRWFSDVETRFGVEKEYREGPTAAEKKLSIYMDSINRQHAIKSRAWRDTLLARQKHRQDSINEANAVQLYQTKVLLDDISKKLNLQNVQD